jgi:hypothetical protein
MKLSAIAQRGSKKDFVDIYALALSRRPLREMLRLYQEKYNVKDIAPVLYGLAYFDDADRERMPTMLWKVDWRAIRRSIRVSLKEIVRYHRDHRLDLVGCGTSFTSWILR